MNEWLVQSPQRARESKDWVLKRADFPKTGPNFFFDFLFFGRSSCGLLGGSRWPWEAVEAIFVEQMVGLNLPKSQGIDGLGSQEGRLSKNWAYFFFCLFFLSVLLWAP